MITIYESPSHVEPFERHEAFLAMLRKDAGAIRDEGYVFLIQIAEMTLEFARKFAQNGF